MIWDDLFDLSFVVKIIILAIGFLLCMPLLL